MDGWTGAALRHGLTLERGGPSPQLQATRAELPNVAGHNFQRCIPVLTCKAEALEQLRGGEYACGQYMMLGMYVCHALKSASRSAMISNLSHECRRTKTDLVEWSRILETALPNLVDSLLGLLLGRASRVVLHRQDSSALDADLMLFAECIETSIDLASPPTVPRQIGSADLRQSELA